MIDLRKAKRVLAGVLIVEMVAIGATHAVRHFAPSNTTVSAVDSEALAAELNETKADLTVNLTKEMVNKAYPEVSREFLDSSMPIRNAERVRLSGNIGTALTFPFTSASQQDGQSYSSEVIQDWWNNELFQEVLRNPVYGVAVARALAELKFSDNTTLGDLNPWINELIAKYDSFFTEGGHGNSDFLTKETESGPILVDDEYRYYAVGLCFLLSRFSPTEVRRVYAERHWGLKPANDLAAEMIRAEVFEEPEDRDALVAYLNSKSGNPMLAIAFNVHDKRPMIPGKKPKPEEETTVTETTPQETPQETTTQETKPHKTPTVNQETTPAPTTPAETKPRKKPRRDPKETTPRETTPKETTPKETTPKETTPKETTPQETTPAETKPQKKRKSDSFNNGGANDGGNSARIGTDVLEPSDPHTETGKGHGDPIKETMVAPTTAASHKDIETQKSDEHRMNQETHTAAPTGERLTGDDGKQIQFGGDASKAAQENVEVNTNDAVEFEDNND